MKIISKIIWSILFILVFLLTLKNTHEGIIYFFSYELRSPMALILFGFLLSGFVLGVMAMMPTFFRHRRDLAKHKKAMDTMQKETEARLVAQSQPPRPDTIVGT